MHDVPRTPWQRAAALAARQRGLLTTQQCLTVGLSKAQLRNAERLRGWDRIARALYVLPGATPGWERDALAACLLAGGGATVSHLTSAALWHWCAAPPLPHVTVGRASSHRTPLARVHRSDVPLVDQATRSGIRCTSASRTLVDCAGLVERNRLALFVDDALCSGVASVDSVLAAAERAGRRGRLGMANLDAVLEVWVEDIRPDTPAEVRLLRRLDDLGVRAVTQHQVYDADGHFVARLDVAIPERMHAFEYDSDRFHNPRGWGRDEPRYARLRALGWRVDPICKLDLLPSATRLADLLAVQAPIAPLASA